MASVQDETNRPEVKINIQTDRERKQVVVAVESSVQDLKEKIASAFGISPFNINMIFMGKILKDAELDLVLQHHKLQENMTIHVLVIEPSTPMVEFSNPWLLEWKYEVEFTEFVKKHLHAHPLEAQLYLHCLQMIRRSKVNQGDCGYFLHRVGRMFATSLIPVRPIPIDNETMSIPETLEDKISFWRAIQALLYFTTHRFERQRKVEFKMVSKERRKGSVNHYRKYLLKCSRKMDFLVAQTEGLITVHNSLSEEEDWIWVNFSSWNWEPLNPIPRFQEEE